MNFLRKTVLSLSLLMVSGFSVAEHHAKPGKGVEVQALQSAIAEETFQTMVLNEALRELGYEVKPIKEVDYSAAYTSIASGDATYMAVNWFPLHNTMYKNAGGDDVVGIQRWESLIPGPPSKALLKLVICAAPG